MKKDELKDIFDAAFAHEALPVDIANWDTLAASLDHQRRRKTIIYWLMGIGLIVGGISGMAAWSSSHLPAYQPDHVSSFHTMDDIQVSKRLPSDNSASNNRMTTKAEKDVATKDVRYAQEEFIHEATFSESHSQSPSGSHTASQKSTPSFSSYPSHASSTLPADSSSSPFDPTSIVDPPIAGQARSEDLLEKMPLRDGHLDAKIKAFSTRNLDTLDQKRPWELYLRAGVAYGKSIDPGQVGGVGISVHLMDNLLFGSELLLVRDFVNLESAVEGRTYGYETYRQAILTQASEMLATELPVFVRYRWNRFSIGGGVTAAYTIGARLTERHYLSSSVSEQPWTSNELTDEIDVGYVRWKAVKPFRLNATTDLSFQLTDRYYVGSRVSYPLQDIFTSNAVNDRFVRLELYLKMSLKP